jgi:hypothetical protein
MTSKSALVFVILVAAARAPSADGQQPPGQVAPSGPSVSVSTHSAAGPLGASRTTEKTNCDCGSLNYPPPHISVAAPVQAPPTWSIPERIAWIANLLLAVMGYVGIMLALSILKKIERQTQSVESAVETSAAVAQAALLHGQGIVRAERPWIMVTAEPSPGVENSSTVVATNRGKSPARIVVTTERILFSPDESHLPPVPEYEAEEAGVSLDPIILLPGESSPIRIFGWGDVKRFCATGEKLKRVEDWDEKIFLYGRITYEDLVSPAGRETHETCWCCWYISGQKRSGLVTIRVPAYNVQT